MGLAALQMADHLTYLSDEAAFKEAIAGLCMIDFTATWCPPCKMIGPQFEALAQEKIKAGGSMKFFKLDVDKNAKAAQAAGIRAMPTFKVFKAGKEIGELVGANKDKLKLLMDKHYE